MASDGQSLREEICDVTTTLHKDDAKLMLANAVPKPVKAHVQRLRHLDVDAVVGEAYGYLVIAEYWCRRLGVAHVMKDLPLVGGDASGGKDTGVFGLSHKGTDNGDASAVGGYWMVERGVVVSVAEEMVTAGDASGIGAGEEGRVRE